jgi:hypothetical protein
MHKLQFVQRKSSCGYDVQYEEKNTGLPELTRDDGLRATWKRTKYEDASWFRLLEKVVAPIDHE